jgi:hypothetical protein
MTSLQFIDWLKQRLEEHGVKKVVPAKDVLESVFKLAVLTKKANDEIARVQAEWGTNGHIDIPADLDQQVRGLMVEKPNLSWDLAVSRVASPPADQEQINHY